MILPEQGLILGGLGKRKSWHPGKTCSLFRALGAKLAQLKNISVDIRITEENSQGLTEYLEKKEGFNAGSDLDLKRKPRLVDRKKKKTKQAPPSSEEDEAESAPDFVADINLSDMITQLVVCLNLEAEPMALLKSKPSSKKESIALSVTAPHVEAKSTTKALERGRVISEMLHGARYLASLPGNYMNPDHYESYTRSLAQEFHLKLEIFDKTALKQMGCGGILAVGQGSAVAPRMLALEYQPPRTKVGRPLVLVGKGITFDTGGISIKPAAEMHEMKYDMCGSALALHAIAVAAALKLPLPVVALLGVAENMPDGNAIKPGDVYTAYDGSTVEIQNTDAEGRLVLGDVLAYASQNYDPLCLLDFATLTGACVVALGHDAAAVMTASEGLYARIQKASMRSLDLSWRMPHWSVYGLGLKSDVADQRNIANRAAGTLSAMRFLSRFVSKEIPWAHFDIAGSAWRNKGFGSQGKGATGWGLRLLTYFMEELCA